MTEEFDLFLEEIERHNQAWIAQQQAMNDHVLKRHAELLEQERRALQDRRKRKQ